MTPNYQASIEFLKRFHPNRLWVITGIHPDPDHVPRTTTATFDEASIETCLTWLDAKGAEFNLYFSVGECKYKLGKKAERTDIENVWYFHVDIDPRAGEDLASEQKRILTLLQSNDKVPPPSVITFSGGGYQGFWALEQPLPIQCKLARAEEAKLYNLQIELDLGADNCHNIDRIMRLPGSINRPDEKKRKKGRTEALAEVIAFADTKYAYTTFKKSPPPSDGVIKGASGAVASIADVKPLANLDELPDKVSDKIKAIIVQGHDPFEPNKFGNSRSEWLFLVVCALVQAGCTDEMILAVITDKRFKISESVLDKKSRIVKYAHRQITRAREETEDSDAGKYLKKMNDRFAVIESINGKCRVIEEQYDEVLDRSRLVKQGFQDFQNRYMNIRVPCGEHEGKPISQPLGLWWLKHHSRRQFSKIIFAPGIDVDGAYNLWRGWGVQPMQGDCQMFLDHIKQNICADNEEHYHYLIHWMAHAVQNPAKPGYAAVVLKGAQGTGKGFVAKTLGSLFGRHFMQVSDPKFLVGSFNAHLRDCVMLFGDEAFFAGDKKHESILKTLITEEFLTIESKGIDAEQSPNCIHLMMASNDHWVVPAGIGDRRFFVLHVGDGRKDDGDYFGAINELMYEKGGREALLHHLLNLDLTEFDVRLIPKTDELQKQKLYSLPAEENWWREKLSEGRLMPEQGEWVGTVPLNDLFYDYVTHCRTTGGVHKKASRSALMMVLGKYMPAGWPRTFHADCNMDVQQMDGTRKMVERPKMISFPPLAECRKHWQQHYGGNDSFENSVPPNDQGKLYGEVI